MSGNLYSIHNDYINATISTIGAELQSLIHKESGIEHMWSGDAKFWAKKSPVLFPIVGGLKQNSYSHNGISYQMSRHGFAREMEFSLTAQTATELTFTIISNNETRKNFPFEFSFDVKYALQENQLLVSYIVKNTGEEKMFFSVGAHPAFAVPLVENTAFEDYFLEFAQIENAERWPLSPDGLIETFSIPYLQNSNIITLQKSLFYEDALVFKKLASSSVAIRSAKTPHGVKVGFDNFPYLGIWNAKDANFVCIEPWCGIADASNASGILSEKEGINMLMPNDSFYRTWSVELF